MAFLHSICVTNHTVNHDEVLHWADNRVVVDRNPPPDIHEINRHRLVATFAGDSEYYLLAT